MMLPAIFISFYLLTVVLCFIKRDWRLRYKKILIGTHLFLFLLILVTIFLINFRGAWFERLCGIAFLVTGSATFALYRTTLRFWQKIYFGCFAFYPFAAAVTFIIDRILFVIIASPLLITLVAPKTRFSNADYEVREQVGLMAPLRLQLIKKGLLTESVIGTCNDENIVRQNISSMTITSQIKDTTKAIITANDKKYETVFAK